MKNIFKQTIASSLLALIGMNTLAWVPQAFADAPTAQIHYTLSLGVPDGGEIDRYHNINYARDHKANSLYLLRNTAVEDLLNTRRSLKILLGGTARTVSVAGDKTVDFAIPGNLIDLYLKGELGAADDDYKTPPPAHSDNSSTRMPGVEDAVSSPHQHDQNTSHGINSDETTDLTKAIHWFDRTEPAYNEALRLRLIAGLAYQAAQITKLDQQIRFVQKDFFESPGIKEQFEKEFVKPASDALFQQGGGPVMLPNQSPIWLQFHGMNDTINVLAGHRSYLLDRYHLLTIEIEGRPLYKHLYQAMRSAGFPDIAALQTAAETRLPGAGAPFQLNKKFDDAVQAELTTMADPARKLGILANLHRTVNHPIDLALIEVLKANTQRLTLLSSQRHFDKPDSCSPTLLDPSPLFSLAQYDDLWEAAATKYGYLSELVDMESAHKEFKECWVKRDKTKQNIRYAAAGLGIGIGVAAIAYLGIATPAVEGLAAEGAGTGASTLAGLGIPMHSWLVGAGFVADAAVATTLYVDSSSAAKTAKGLYLGSTHIGKNANVQAAIEMKDSDFQMMLASVINLGLSTANLARLAFARSISVRNGLTMVEVTNEDLVAIRKNLTEISGGASELAPMGKALLATVEGLIGTNAKRGALKELNVAIEALAQELKVSPKVILTRLENTPGLGGLIKGWRMRRLSNNIVIAENLLKELAGDEKISAPSTLGKGMAIQQANNFVVSVVSEYLARGDKMLHQQRGEFIDDMIGSTLVTAVLAWSGATINPLAKAQFAEQATQAPSKLSIAMGRLGALLGDGFWGSFAKTGATNGLVGMIIRGVTDGKSQAIQYVDNLDNDQAPTAWDRTKSWGRGVAWRGLTMGISSTSRYQFFSWLERYIGTQAADGLGRTIIIQSAWTGNNLFGGWSSVYVGEHLGFLDSSQKPATGSDIATLQVSSLTGGFFKSSIDDKTAGYMFDFLRDGPEAAGSAPALQ